MGLLQPSVLRFRLHQNWDIGVGVFPEGEKIGVRQPGLVLVAGEHECSPQLQMRQCANGIRADKAAMVENLLKFRHSFRISVRGNQCLAPHIGGVQPTQIEMIEVEAVHREFIG